MSATVVATLMPAKVLAADGGGGFQAPSIGDFYWPVIAGQDSHWAITRPAVVMGITVVILIWFYVSVTGRLSLVPSKRQWLAEQLYDFVRNTIARDLIGTKDFKPFLPLLFSLFTVIMFNNLMGIIPFFQYPTMGRIAFPLVLTLIVYVVYHVVGLKRKHGVVGYLSSLIPSGLPGWLKAPMFIIEFLTYFFIRPLTLALRLFGNMMAGHLVVLSCMGLIFFFARDLGNAAYAVAVPSVGLAAFVMIIEGFVALMQAYIFTYLSILFVGACMHPEH